MAWFKFDCLVGLWAIMQNNWKILFNWFFSKKESNLIKQRDIVKITLKSGKELSGIIKITQDTSYVIKELNIVGKYHVIDKADIDTIEVIR